MKFLFNKLVINFSNLWFSQVKSHKDLVHFETAYVVKLHSIAKLAPTKPVGLHLY